MCYGVLMLTEKQRASQRKWREENKEREKAYSRKYYIEHHEECKRKRREWYYRTKKPCPICGKTIISHVAKACCSCHFRGANNPRWKGGHILSRGYVLVHTPNHPRADNHGYIREHVLIWEQFNNKLLLEGWIIHHLNGIRNDNRIVNLVALPDKKHRHILSAKAKRIQELEALLNHQSQLV